jgi:hypothetical protein
MSLASSKVPWSVFNSLMFNDNRIFAGHQYKILVPKGEEFIRVEIKAF